MAHRDTFVYIMENSNHNERKVSGGSRGEREVLIGALMIIVRVIPCLLTVASLSEPILVLVL